MCPQHDLLHDHESRYCVDIKLLFSEWSLVIRFHLPTYLWCFLWKTCKKTLKNAILFADYPILLPSSLPSSLCIQTSCLYSNSTNTITKLLSNDGQHLIGSYMQNIHWGHWGHGFFSGDLAVLAAWEGHIWTRHLAVEMWSHRSTFVWGILITNSMSV